MADIFGTTYSDNRSKDEILAGTNANDTIDHKGGSDTIDGGAGIDTVLFNDSKNNFWITTIAGITHVVGSSIATANYRNTDAIITSIEGLQFSDGLVPLAGITPSGLILDNYSFAYPRNDGITGTNGENIIDPQGGSDTINGGAGNDSVTIFDNKDNFSITTIAGITHVIGSSIANANYRGSDLILTHVETVQFSDGIVPITGVSPSGIMLGVSASQYSPESIIGTTGDNTIDPRGGNDTIDGGAGIDNVLFFDSQANFSITTIAGITHVTGLALANSAYRGQNVILTNVETIQFTDAIVPIRGKSPSGILFGTTSSLYSPESIIGTNGNNTIDPRGGNDTIDGGTGLDNVLFLDKKSNFTISNVAGVIHVKGLSTANTNYRGAEALLSNVEKVTFLDTAMMFDSAGITGQAYRIYKAAFDRTPDAGGLGFWIDTLEKGIDLTSAAAGFIQSAEFTALYGANPPPESFINKVYNNVLHRAIDQGGFDFWLKTMQSGANSQASVLAQFSESPENQAAVVNIIGSGVEYTPFVA
jgi:Ca2+-binding RTX toxin-like protein